MSELRYALTERTRKKQAIIQTAIFSFFLNAQWHVFLLAVLAYSDMRQVSTWQIQNKQLPVRTQAKSF